MAENFEAFLGRENLTNSNVVVLRTNYNAPNLILLHPPFFEFQKGQANSTLQSPILKRFANSKKSLMAENFSDSIVAVIGKALKRIRGS